MSDLFMNKSSDDWNKLKHLVDLSAENARLKAEVERLTNCKSEADRLKAEVDRLRKAGDAMAEAMWYGDAERSIWVKKFAETEWHAAKEGKQP